VEVALLPRVEARPTLAPKPLPGVKNGSKSVAPVQLVQEAQKAARLEPSARGYFGSSAEHVYQWAPGKVYTIYLTKKHATAIVLPPGERLLSGLYLDGEAYEVRKDRAGTAGGVYEAITIRPLVDSGEVEAFVLTESGRRYLFHFVVGPTGMLAVTFEGTRVDTHTRAVAPALVLPRPPQ
jgi:type IV secretory pathway VirB9-like protein